jgi:hypothetical protein
VHPHGTGGEATVENIQLRCRAHNAYEAALFYGPMRDGSETVCEAIPGWDVSPALSRAAVIGRPNRTRLRTRDNPLLVRPVLGGSTYRQRPAADPPGHGWRQSKPRTRSPCSPSRSVQHCAELRGFRRSLASAASAHCSTARIATA